MAVESNGEIERLRLALGRAIRDARKAAKLTQDELASAVGTTQATLSRWELGDPVTLDQLVAVEIMLGLHRGELLVAAGYVPDVRSAEDAIKLDPGLTDKFDRQALLVLYSIYLERKPSAD